MKIQVCVGSSCHLRGSHDIITMLQKAIAEHHLEDRIELSASFCLGKCTEGVSVKVDDRILCVLPETFQEFFKKEVLDQLEAQ